MSYGKFSIHLSDDSLKTFYFSSLKNSKYIEKLFGNISSVCAFVMRIYKKA